MWHKETLIRQGLLVQEGFAWLNFYHIGSGSPIHGSVLEEFPKGHGDTDEDEHSVSSVDGRTVKEDYPGFRGHAVSIRPGLQGWLG